MSPAMTVKSAIHARLSELSAGERKVARAVLERYPGSGLGTAAELAAAAGVSAPTVVRFADRLGFEGLSGLQRALKAELGNELGSPLRQYEAKARGGADGLVEEMHASLSGLLERTQADLPRSEFDRLAALLADPSRPVVALGGRFTSVAADYLCSHLALLRPGVDVLRTDGISGRAALMDVPRGAVAVVFDVRRHTAQTEEAARRLAERGAVVAAVTDAWRSPVAQFADLVLPVHVESRSPFDSIIGVMALVESLIASVTVELGVQGEERIAEYERLWSE